MITFAAEPFVVTLDDGNVAADDGDILLLGVDGPQGLLLAAGKLEWYPIIKMTIVGQLVRADENVPPPQEEEETDD